MVAGASIWRELQGHSSRTCHEVARSNKLAARAPHSSILIGTLLIIYLIRHQVWGLGWVGCRRLRKHVHRYRLSETGLMWLVRWRCHFNCHDTQHIFSLLLEMGTTVNQIHRNMMFSTCPPTIFRRNEENLSTQYSPSLLVFIRQQFGT